MIKSVAEELNVNCHAVKKWMKRRSEQLGKSGALTEKKKRSKGWSRDTRNWEHVGVAHLNPDQNRQSSRTKRVLYGANKYN